MKVLFIAVGLIICLMFIGWISVGTDGENPTISFDTQEAKDDTAKAVEVGKDLVAEGKEFIDEAGERINDETEAEPLEDK